LRRQHRQGELERELAVGTVEVLVLPGRGRGQDEIGVVRRVRQHLLVDDREEVSRASPAKTRVWSGQTAAGFEL